MAKRAIQETSNLHSIDEIMRKHDLTEEDVIYAIERYINDLKFEKDLDAHYKNLLDDSWEYWHEGDI